MAKAKGPKKAMSDANRTLVWETRWKAHVNVRYFCILGARYGLASTAINWLMALSASAAVVKWTIWSQLPGSLETLSGVTALLSLFNVAFGMPARVSALCDLQVKWTDYRTDCDLAWAKVADGGTMTLDGTERLKRKETELKKLELPFRTYKSILDTAQNEACDALGIPRKAVA